MPLFVPFLIGGAVAALTGAGARKGTDGLANMKRAQSLAAAAEGRHRSSVERLESRREVTNARAEEYADFQAKVVATTLRRWLELIERLQRRGQLKDIETLAGIDISPQRLEADRTFVLKADSFLKGGMNAAAAGFAMGKGAAVLVGWFGAASTGTAISGLSGIAAQNALLAWLGGGSLAAGGFGVLGGTLLLGGITIAPAVAVIGFSLASKGEEAMTRAVQFCAQVDAEVAKLGTACDLLQSVETRIGELRTVLEGLHLRAEAALSRLDPASFSLESDADVRAFQAAGQLVAAVSEVVRTPILTSAGELDPAGARLVARFRPLVETP